MKPETFMLVPFKGFMSQRPYPKVELTTQEWKDTIDPTIVYLSDLTLTQTKVRISALFGVKEEHPEADGVPHVVFWCGEYYLDDGHHRVVRHALYGIATMRMRVYVHGTRIQRIIRPSEGAGGRFV